MTDTTGVAACGAWPRLGGCILPSGHNMGSVDVPANHQFASTRRVRVIRVLEYDYPDQETYERDISNWSVPPNGVRSNWGHIRGIGVSSGTVIRSATTLMETMPHQDGPTDDQKEPSSE